MFAVEMHHITKRFGSLLANDDVSLQVKSGEIHALVGENGAGKSTLMNILYGMYIPDAGSISIEGTERRFATPAAAIAAGIGMVHQHFMLIPTLTVAENVILGQEQRTSFTPLKLRQAAALVKALADRYHLALDPSAIVGTLSVGLQQRVELLKLLYRNASVLILDEPTPVLIPQEVEDLFNTLRELKVQQKTIILITHKLREVMTISDSITVMRRGKMVASMPTSSTDQESLAREMVGKELDSPPERTTSPSDRPGLIVEHLCANNDRKLPVLRDVSFTVYQGEILGIAAIEGNGQSELVQAITGLRKPTSGSVLIPDRKMSAESIAHIPEDRLRYGLIGDFSLRENLILGRHRDTEFSRPFHLLRANIERFAASCIRAFDIRPPHAEQRAKAFSGGNQQKAILSRELSKDAPVIIASQPTRGLDIAAISFVHRKLEEERAGGKAILLVSSDLEELLTLSDRIGVMYEGEVAAFFKACDTNEYELGRYMTGAIRRSA